MFRVFRRRSPWESIRSPLLNVYRCTEPKRSNRGRHWWVMVTPNQWRSQVFLTKEELVGPEYGAWIRCQNLRGSWSPKNQCHSKLLYPKMAGFTMVLEFCYEIDSYKCWTFCIQWFYLKTINKRYKRDTEILRIRSEQDWISSRMPKASHSLEYILSSART